MSVVGAAANQGVFIPGIHGQDHIVLVNFCDLGGHFQSAAQRTGCQVADFHFGAYAWYNPFGKWVLINSRAVLSINAIRIGVANTETEPLPI